MSSTTTDETVDLGTPDVVIRLLATGGNADERYPVPSKQRFKDAGEGVIEAEDLERIARALILDEFLPLGHLAALRIGYLWAERGGSAGGFPCFGRLIKASKALLHYAEIDYLVMLSADHLRDAKATRWQVEALVGHQLGHVEMLVTEKGEDRYSVKGHDFEGFAFEFRRWGAYLPGMVVPAQAASSAVQMGLVFEEGDDDDGGDFDPAVDRAPGVEDEIGPGPDGAPAAEWAGEYDEPSAAEVEAMLGGEEDAIFGDVSPSEETLRDDLEIRLSVIREEYGTKINMGGTEVCRRCGIAAAEHALDRCDGGTPSIENVDKERTGLRKPHDKSPKNRSGATGAGSEESGIAGEDRVLGDLGASSFPLANGTNGNHDRDDAAGILLDPDRVCQTLAERGWKIAYQAPFDGAEGIYLNSETFAVYDTGDVEAEFRAVLAGRA
jgi:hypothetical protein